MIRAVRRLGNWITLLAIVVAVAFVETFAHEDRWGDE